MIALYVYLAGVLTTAGLQLIGAVYAVVKFKGMVPPKGFEAPRWHDAFWCTVNSVLWFVFLPLVLHAESRKRRVSRAR